MRTQTSPQEKNHRQNPFKDPRLAEVKRKSSASSVRRKALRVPRVIDTPEGTIEENNREAAP